MQQFVDHVWNELLRPFVWLPEVWIGVHLDQPHTKVFVDHEVVTEKLEGILSVIWVGGALDRQESIDDNILHPRDQVVLHIHSDFRSTYGQLPFSAELFAIQVLLKRIIAQSIAFFVLAVCVLVLHLEALVGQMHRQICAVE